MKNGFMKVIAGCLVVIPFIMASCLTNDAEEIPDFNEQLQKDIAAIDAYLTANNIVAIQDNSGLRYVIYVDSVDGEKPTREGCVTANYSGRLLANGQEFDKGTNISFPLNNVIDGWKIGIPLLNVGDSAELYIPSGLGYGYLGHPAALIPSNANLVFLVGVKKVGTTYKSADRSCN